MDESQIREFIKQEMAAMADGMAERIADHLFNRLIAMNLSNGDGLQISMSGRFSLKPLRKSGKASDGSSYDLPL